MNTKVFKKIFLNDHMFENVRKFVLEDPVHKGIILGTLISCILVFLVIYIGFSSVILIFGGFLAILIVRKDLRDVNFFNSLEIGGMTAIFSSIYGCYLLWRANEVEKISSWAQYIFVTVLAGAMIAAVFFRKRK
ncbi:hypothetical protein DRN45_07040 [Thermococci archaeon]|nr:MAG: hypothetical protein DRN45_07040 [Thermococci archaeon]